jgi:hypothetical protein
MKKRLYIPQGISTLKKVRSDAGEGIYSVFMAGSYVRGYIQSILPIYCQIRRICELEFRYAALGEITWNRPVKR